MTTKMKRKSKAALGILLTLSSCGVAYAYCPPQYQEAWVDPTFKAAIATIEGALSAVDVSLSALLETNSQRLTSAIAILTKQKALAANQIADSQVRAGKMTAEGLRTLAETERVKKARFDYGGEFGQGYQPCKINASRALIATRNADLQSELGKRVRSEIVAGAGKYADPIKAREEQLNEHKKYCTADEVNSGLCPAEGALAGADTNIGTLFHEDMEGDDTYAAKNAFINNLAGLPDPEIPKQGASSANASSYILAKAKKDAFLSPAYAALKEIQIDYSGIEGTESGKELPMSVLIKNEVNRYAGNSAEYDAWSRTMTSQNDRGTLVELLKIKALELAIQAREYRQYEMMEAQLASLTALQVQTTIAPAAEAAAIKASVNQVNQQIR
ncbi:hypothetical protein [Yersinia ruckeri]